MKNEIVVRRDELYKVYENIKASIVTLQLMLAEVGCVHKDSQNVTTMADKANGLKKWFCPDCDQIIEEEV